MARGDTTRVENVKIVMLKGEKGDPTPPTDEQVVEALETMGEPWVDAWLDDNASGPVGDWLDDHPDATTTVQDGAISEVKLNDELKLKTINNYVTPEMFGAKGDGVTDDTNAFQQALSSGKVVKLANKSYKVSQLVINTTGSSIIGSGSARTTIICATGIELTDATNTKLKGFTIWSGLPLASERTNNDGTGINLNADTSSTSITREQFDDIIVSGYYIGINSNGLWTVEFRNIRVDYCWYAFVLTNGFGANFTNCYFTSSNRVLLYITNKGFSLAFNSCNFGIKNTDSFIFANGENSVVLFNSCNLECDDVVTYQEGSRYIFYTDKGTYVFNACTLWSNIGTSDVYFFRGNNYSRFILNQSIQRLYYGGQYSSNWFNPSDTELVSIDNVGTNPIFDIRNSAPTQFMAGTVYFDSNDNSLKIRQNGAWKRIGTGTVFSSSQPSDDIGQLWANDHDVYIQTENKGWLPLNVYVDSSAPTIYGVGTLWFDTSTNKLKVRANGQWNAIN